MVASEQYCTFVSVSIT